MNEPQALNHSKEQKTTLRISAPIENKTDEGFTGQKIMRVKKRGQQL